MPEKLIGSLCQRRVSRNVNKMGGDKKTNKTPMEIINMDRKTEFTLAVLIKSSS